MEKRAKFMEEQTKHLMPYRRKFSLLPRIGAIGFLPSKQERIQQVFASCNFSFILKGRGDYFLKGKRFFVEAPCIIIQWPGEPMDYGPVGEWSELYFIYPPENFALFTTSGLMNTNVPVRPLQNLSKIQEKTDCLQQALNRDDFSVDRIDLLCYELLLESWLKSEEEQLNRSRIPEICRRLESHLGREINCTALAAEFGMSLSSLRRYWRHYYGRKSFSAYRNECFIRKSCQLLVETNRQIKEIAAELEFNDSFYFSRKFRQLTGLSPQEYRRKYHRGYWIANVM